jgi:hypothetical protein
MSAVTTGVANHNTCIGSGGADVVFCELRSPALRHICSGRALVAGLEFVADLVDVTAKSHDYVAPSRARDLLTSASNYLAGLSAFNVTN